MRILFIIAFPPNNKTAGQNYTRQLLEQLSKEYQIDLIYWNYPNHPINIPNNIKILKEINLSSKKINLTNCYFPFFSRRYSKKVVDYINSISSNYDYIYFDFSQVFLYSTKISHPHKIGMSHDVIAQKFERHSFIKYLLPWIRYSEKKCLKSLNHVLTFSRKDSEYLNREYRINSSIVSFLIESDISNIKLDQGIIKDYLVMYGAWNRPENQESIHWLINHIEDLNITIKIIGGGMPDELSSRFSHYPNINYLGFIDNPYPIIAESKGLLAPLFHGAGVKVKVIESLALGTPVIGTDVTFEGIDNIDYKESGVLINLSIYNITEAIDLINEITQDDKKKIQQSFLYSYRSNTFIDFLKNLYNNGG